MEKNFLWSATAINIGEYVFNERKINRPDHEEDLLVKDKWPINPSIKLKHSNNDFLGEFYWTLPFETATISSQAVVLSRSTDNVWSSGVEKYLVNINVSLLQVQRGAVKETPVVWLSWTCKELLLVHFHLPSV